MKPRSINIFLLDGDPNGIRVAQIMMSTIQAIAFRRNKLGEVRKTFSEIERPGVYILIGEDEAEPDRHIAYIGESEAIGERLGTHNSNKAGRDSKDFWTDTVVLISKDENLTKSHARYVEACLIRSTGNNPRWLLPNTNMPSGNAGKLPLPDRAAMDEFVDQTKTLVGARLIPFTPDLHDVEFSALQGARVPVLFCSCQPVGKPIDRCPVKRSTRAFTTRTRVRSIWRTGAGRRASSAPLAAPAKAGP